MAVGNAPGGPGNRGSFDAELPLDLRDARLPWLESDDDESQGRGQGRTAFMLVAIVLLLAIFGGSFWYVRHRQQEAAMVVAGGVIKAPPGPYKVRPANPGGSVAQGTGDTSFLVAEGRDRLPAGAAHPGAAEAVPSGAVPAPLPSGAAGVGVQIGAYASAAEAEAAWATLSQRVPILSGLHHRVVESRADLGSVFALQAVTVTTDGARSLCEQLRATRMNCQVKG